MNKNSVLKAISLVLVFLAGACAAPQSEVGTTIRTSGVRSIDPTKSDRSGTTVLTLADYLRFAEKVTNQMLASPFVANWGNERPRLAVGRVRNNSDDENILVGDIAERIKGTIVNSTVARIVNAAEDFDYVVNVELSSTHSYGDGGTEAAFFVVRFKLSDVAGELVGQWSDQFALSTR